MSDINTLNVTVVFLETLNRQPTSDELALYVPQFAAATMAPSDLQTLLQSTVEYQTLQGTYSGNMSFDNAAWTLTLTNLVDSHYNGLT